MCSVPQVEQTRRFGRIDWFHGDVETKPWYSVATSYVVCVHIFTYKWFTLERHFSLSFKDWTMILEIKDRFDLVINLIQNLFEKTWK